MTDARAVLGDVLDEVPGSIRELAREAGVSHALLVAIRDGERRATPATRDAVVQALRRWQERCGSLADALESADLEPGGSDE